MVFSLFGFALIVRHGSWAQSALLIIIASDVPETLKTENF
jgi:hypothetical protein